MGQDCKVLPHFCIITVEDLTGLKIEEAHLDQINILQIDRGNESHCQTVSWRTCQ
jgi:hypothetical protein